MKAINLLLADKTWAKLYKPGVDGDALALVYHQKALIGHSPNAGIDREFIGNVSRLIRSERQAGGVDALVVMAAEAVMPMLLDLLGDDWNGLLVSQVVEIPHLLSQETLLARLSDMGMLTCKAAGTP